MVRVVGETYRTRGWVVTLPVLEPRSWVVEPVVPVTRGVREVEPRLGVRDEPLEGRTVTPDERVELPDERVEPPDCRIVPPDDLDEPPEDDRVDPWERDWLLPTDERVEPDELLMDDPELRVEPDEELPRELPRWASATGARSIVTRASRGRKIKREKVMVRMVLVQLGARGKSRHNRTAKSVPNHNRD